MFVLFVIFILRGMFFIKVNFGYFKVNFKIVCWYKIFLLFFFILLKLLFIFIVIWCWVIFLRLNDVLKVDSGIILVFNVNV